MSENKKNNDLKGPRDKTLAFFTYGIFKPGQIAYSRIKEYVEDSNEEKVKYEMKHRDGVPILLSKEKDNYETYGYLLNFNDIEAYRIINKTLSNRLYRWGTIDIGDKKANVLFGNKPFNGSNSIESPSDRKNYDGKNDPLFKEGIELIKENIDSESFSWEKGFFKLQMNYMLLWSAIDRYCKLRYNKEKDHENREELSKEKVFRDALNKYAGGKHYRTLFTSDDLSERKFDLDDPKYCLNYYYTLRCNIVHRGKTSMRDIHLLRDATEDLLNIFEYVLDDTFNEN